MNDRKRLLLMALLGVWLLLYGYSFWAFATTPKTGDGFTRGLNRVTTFFGWQLAAAIPAFAAWAVGRDWPRGSGVRYVSRVPILLALGLVAVIGGLIVWARFTG